MISYRFEEEYDRNVVGDPSDPGPMLILIFIVLGTVLIFLS